MNLRTDRDRAREAAYRAAHRVERAEASRRRYAEKRDEINAKARERRDRTVEQRKAYRKAYYQANREKIRTQAAERYMANKAEFRRRGREWWAKNRVEGRERMRTRRIQKLYGLDAPSIEKRLAAQKNACAICKKAFTHTPTGKFRVDHCHRSGCVRGLLCNKCNSGLGMLSDSPVLLRAALAYLEESA